MRRRDVLRLSGTILLSRAVRAGVPRVTSPKRVLVLGGTGFLGPATVQCLKDRGHTVTLFNRGRSSPELFSSLEKLRGDRDPKLGNLTALHGERRWDVVIDVWPQEPDMVEATARLLATRTQHYVYVSSVAAYDGYPRPGMDEQSPLRPWNAAADDYGMNKAESERRLQALVGAKFTVVRPGPIKGDRDGGPDLVTWLMRTRSGGRHIGPGDGSDAVQFVDVKDVALFLADCVDHRCLGAWNLTGNSVTFRDFLAKCTTIAGSSEARFIWIPHTFLTAHGLKSDYELQVYSGNFPFWRPEPAITNIFRVSSAKAYTAGWRTRPLEATARDCLLTFGLGEGGTSNWKDFMDPAREAEVLSAWQQLHPEI